VVSVLDGYFETSHSINRTTDVPRPSEKAGRKTIPIPLFADARNPD
jgi:hypothetical protein